MNILLPLSPFFLRIFIIFIGKEQLTSTIKIFELPELMFFSIFTCIAGLNINIDKEKRYFESFLRLLLVIIIVLDFVALGMMYSNNTGPNSLLYSIISAITPMIIAPLYKLYSDRQERSDG